MIGVVTLQNASLKKKPLASRYLSTVLGLPLLKKKIKTTRKESALREQVGYGGDMGKTKPLTAEEQAALDEGWTEIGESIAGTILVGRRTKKWAWDLIGPLGIYERWMIDKWVERYQDEHPELNSPVSATTKERKNSRPVKEKSVFTKRDEIKEALRLLSIKTGR